MSAIQFRQSHTKSWKVVEFMRHAKEHYKSIVFLVHAHKIVTQVAFKATKMIGHNVVYTDKHGNIQSTGGMHEEKNKRFTR